MLRAPVRRGRLATKEKVVVSKALPAPVEGWDASSALANMPPLRAVQLTNWWPQPGYIEVRKGRRYHAWDIGSSVKTVSSVNTGTETLTSNAHGMADGTLVKLVSLGGSLPTGLSTSRPYYIITSATNTFQLSTSAGGSAVNLTSAGSGTIYVYTLSEPEVETLAIWQGPSSSAMFAAAGGAIWNVTSAVAGVLSYAVGATSNRWQWCNHTTSGGSYLFMCNGADAPVHYNGTAWAAPAITGITVANIIQAISHKKRLWFVLKDSTQGAYLGTEAVAGAASAFEFGSLFTRGGYLQAIATWTRDGGAGVDDYFIAVSSRGQAALYSGTDPASANTWSLVGVFDVPPPLGRRCFTKFGGDLLFISQTGVYPMSQLLSVDQSQARRVSITDRVAVPFTEKAADYGSLFGWEVVVYPKKTAILVNIPTSENATSVQYAMNTLTGAWCDFDSWDANCFAVYNDGLYFAGHAGDVYLADYGRSDVDQPITAVGQTAYSALGTPRVKRFSMLRPLITASGTNRPSLGLSLDFSETSAMSASSSAGTTPGALWDAAVWDTSSWSDNDAQVADWTNVIGVGTFGSIKFQAQTGVTVGSIGWGTKTWGTGLWGSEGLSDETMRIQGFVVLAEQGEFL